MSALIALGLAWGVPLVADGEVPREVPADADSVELAELMRRPPVALDGGTALGCAGGVDPEVAAADAEGELNYMNDAAAAERAEAGLVALACAREPVDPRLVGRLALLRGVAAHLLQDTETARRHLAWARSLGARWDERFGEDGRAVFEAATVGAPVALGVVAPGYPDVWVDGARAEQAAPGRHVVQVQGPSGLLSALVDIEGPDRIAFPAALVVTGPPSPETSDLLEAALGPVDVVVAQDGRAWRGVAGGDAWTALHVETRRGRPAWMAAGGALAAGGLVTVAVARGQAAAADADRCAAVDRAAWDDADARHGRAEALYWAGWGASAVGAALGLTGAVLPRPVAGGVGVEVRF